MGFLDLGRGMVWMDFDGLEFILGGRTLWELSEILHNERVEEGPEGRTRQECWSHMGFRQDFRKFHILQCCLMICSRVFIF